MTPFAVRPGIPLTRAELATLTAPTLLVLGADDIILTQTAGAGSMSAVAGGRMLEVAGGHAPWLDDPTVPNAVAAFLGEPS
jgi:pimeloyl-ACP methyl ester carboxylesterase